MSEEVQLSLQDVAACVHIIDIVSKREANKPAEAEEDNAESDGE